MTTKPSSGAASGPAALVQVAVLAPGALRNSSTHRPPEAARRIGRLIANRVEVPLTQRKLADPGERLARSSSRSF